MALNEAIIQKLRKTYEPSTLINAHYNGKDLAFKTDAEGNPVLLFIGKENESGTIKGDRYARTLKRDASGTVIKDHWERKGNAT